MAEHRGVRAIQALIELAPATGGLALWAQHRDIPGLACPIRPGSSAGLIVPGHAAEAGTALAPVIATDGHRVYYTPAFARLELDRQMGLVAQVMLHLALRHPQRAAALAAVHGPIDLGLYNLCADALINCLLGHLDWLRLPDGAVSLERLLAATLGLRTTPEAALLAWDVERLYRSIDDRAPVADSRSRTRRDGPRAEAARRLAAGIARDLIVPASEAEPEAEAALARDWSERLRRGHGSDGALSLLRTLPLDRGLTPVPWEWQLRRRLWRGLLCQPDRSWSRPARSWLANRGRTPGGGRLPWEPGWVASRQVPRLVLVVDVSGSIDDALLHRFGSEVGAIARRANAELFLIAGDDRVRWQGPVQPGRLNLADLQFDGGGGTDFSPLLEAADTCRPDLVLVLTDLDGPNRFEPEWPLVWAVAPGWSGQRPAVGEVVPLA